jgi:hypothetical protein
MTMSKKSTKGKKPAFEHGSKTWNKLIEATVLGTQAALDESELDDCCRESVAIMVAVQRSVANKRELQSLINMVTAEYGSLTGVEYMASVIPKAMYDMVMGSMIGAPPEVKH